jgi:hypothetical protein
MGVAAKAVWLTQHAHRSIIMLRRRWTRMGARSYSLPPFLSKIVAHNHKRLLQPCRDAPTIITAVALRNGGYAAAPFICFNWG